MIARLRSFWLNVNASYWFYPALFSTFAFALSIFTVYLDRNGTAEWMNDIAWLSPARPDGARNVLNVIAGSMIGVASTVFSITIAAVAYASGNYGPRLLTNFMEDKGNQLSLGTFIATFVYSVMVLRVVRAEDEKAATIVDAVATSAPGFVPQLSLLIATVMAGIAVAVLVYFLNHIPSSIRINTVLKGIGVRLIEDIKDRYPDDIQEREPHEQTKGETVSAHKVGYIRIIDFDGLNDLAEKHEATIVLKIRTGDFIHGNVALVEVAGAELDENLTQEIRDCFSAGEAPSATQDLEYLIDELVEIALRALSPGINDPFTAITSMHWLGAATAELARRDLARGPEQENYDWNRVQQLNDGFDHFIERGFGSIRSAAATSPLAAVKFLDSLYSISTTCKSNKRRNLLFKEGRLLLEQAQTELKGPSMDEIQARFDSYIWEMQQAGI